MDNEHLNATANEEEAAFENPYASEAWAQELNDMLKRNLAGLESSLEEGLFRGCMYLPGTVIAVPTYVILERLNLSCMAVLPVRVHPERAEVLRRLEELACRLNFVGFLGKFVINCEEGEISMREVLPLLPEDGPTVEDMEKMITRLVWTMDACAPAFLEAIYTEDPIEEIFIRHTAAE